MNAVETLAAELSQEADPRWKDDWERGYDAGRSDAGSALQKALESDRA